MNSTIEMQTALDNMTICEKHLINQTLTIICNNSSSILPNQSNEDTSPTSAPHIALQTSDIMRYFLTALIFMLIVVGNSLTIHVVRNNRNLTSIKNYYYGYYIVNLSISDLLVGLVCLPTTILYYVIPGKWIMGEFLCKLFPTLQVIVVSASISTLTVITFERFSAIVHPLKPRSTTRKIWFKIAAVWIWSCIIALPSFIAYRINSKQQCEEIGTEKWYTIVLFLVNYALPLMFIFVTYIRMLYELNCQSRNGSKRELANHKRFIKLTIILVLGFALCYLPSNVVFFILEFTTVKMDPQTLTTMLQYFHLLVWFNSCMNPFIYGSVDTYFKRGFKKAFGLGSSCDSQAEKTNLSRMSTFKSERPSPANHRWLPPELPKTESPHLNGVAQDARFQSPVAGCENSSIHDDIETRLLRADPNCDNNNRDGVDQIQDTPALFQRHLISDKGYSRLEPAELEKNSANRVSEVDSDENQELFVDLSSQFRKTSAIEKQILNNQRLKFLADDGFLEEFCQSKETKL